ncbi:MAG: putative PEP-binding protein [Butyricicoccus sp.]
MKYITAIDAVEGLESAFDTDGIMFTSEDCLMRLENQRLLIQSLMIDPPETAADPRLEHLHRCQVMLWSEKIEECAKKQLCIRLPDRPIDAFLPATSSELTRLSAYMSRPIEWLRGQIVTLRDVNPDLSCRGCRMLISNELVFRTFLSALFSTAQQCSVPALSVLIPFVPESREVTYLKEIIQEYAAAHEITCSIGVEIATPRAACIAGELAAEADAIVFNVDELVQLLYGMSRKDTRKIICHYLHEHVFRHNPFTEFDDIGIGSLLTIALKQIREVNPDLRLSAIGYPTLTEKGRQFCSNMGIQMLIGPQYLFRAEKLFGAAEENDPADAKQEPSSDSL